MLQELRVESLLLIEQAQLRLAPGLNVLTGETGAGKTVLAHALDLLLGGRARAGIVRPGASEAYVEGIFDLPPHLRHELRQRISPDAQELTLARRVRADGRTRAYICGRSATVAELRRLSAALLSFYGQHEHRKLTLAAAQLDILDSACHGDHAARVRACAAADAQARQLERQLQGLRQLADARERELGLLQHELAEIDELAPELDRHEQLLAARERLRRLDSLQHAAGAGAEALAPDSGDVPGAAQLTAAAASALDALHGVDPTLDALAQRTRALAIESDDLAHELRDYCEHAAAHALDQALAHIGPHVSLDTLEQRLSAVERLLRKHGGSVQAVREHAQQARQRHQQLAGADVALANATRQLARARAQLHDSARSLSSARHAAAQRFAPAVRRQLRALAMDRASFDVQLTQRPPGPTGADAVEFTIAPNPGVPAGPLREIASGGELSRVMLAIMSVAHERDERAGGAGGTGGDGASGPTLVFDEVDAGIGGHTARLVGARLRQLAHSTQVICITHLPQIASLGDRHFSIVKDTSAQPTLATVVQLDEPNVVAELVRMLGADSHDSAAHQHALELRRAA
jgi:DNA repair protein RecN (Recombination protein N)